MTRPGSFLNGILRESTLAQIVANIRADSCDMADAALQVPASNFSSGTLAAPEERYVYGRLEVAGQHFHRTLSQAIEQLSTPAPRADQGAM